MDSFYWVVGFYGLLKKKLLDVEPVQITQQAGRSDSWQLCTAGGIAV